MHNIMDEFHILHDEQKKPDTKENRLHNSIHMKFKNRRNKLWH